VSKFTKKELRQQQRIKDAVLAARGDLFLCKKFKVICKSKLERLHLSLASLYRMKTKTAKHKQCILFCFLIFMIKTIIVYGLLTQTHNKRHEEAKKSGFSLVDRVIAYWSTRCGYISSAALSLKLFILCFILLELTGPRN